MSGTPGTALQPSPVEVDKARWLTGTLTAPAGPAPTAGERLELRRQLEAALTAAGPVAQRPLRVDGYLLARAGTARPADTVPFSWSPRTARRSAGLAAVRLCVAGRARTPAAAVPLVLAQLCDDAAEGRVGEGSMARWLRRLPPGGRAAVQAEATTWATRLFTALHWDRLPGRPEIGGRDQWWDCPGGAVALRGRADLRVTGGGALFTMLGGHPGPAAPLELGLAALVAAVAGADGPGGRAGAPVPSRVVGWWPDCGRALALPVDLPMLERTADGVARVVHAVRAEGRPGARSGGGSVRL